MWTNVFRIGGLHHVSWFQFLPNESELSANRMDKTEQNDGATYLVLSSCLELQKEGFLSTWTNSFVGPWDPSQGLHNPDEKIKLWLFLPGRHSLVVETAKAAVSRLRVVACGLWMAPGDSEEVAVALSQALRNCVERALSGLSYMRFGDVFSKYSPYQSDKYLRKGQPTVEFIFAATEEAIFVHAIISAKNVRALSNGDVETAVDSSFSNSSFKLPVIVSPHGMRGNATGFCSNDLVKQVYFSSGSYRSPGGQVGLPTHVGKGSGCKMGGQNCCVEVKLGCSRSMTHKAIRPNSNVTLPMKFSLESSEVVRGDRRELSDQLPAFEKTFIYPPEAVLVPVLQTPLSRSSLKRFWLQNWIGPSVEGSLFFMHWAGEFDSFEASGRGNGISMQSGYNSSGNSNNSSISSTSSTTSESDYKMTSTASDLEADADSLTCRQSGLSYNDQLDYDRAKMGSKRPRAEMTESFGQVGIGSDLVGSHWDWDDDKGVGMDIQALMLEFGDFGDFFENDALPFGEPPGTAESQALALPLPDSGDFGTSPVAVMDVSDQMLLPGGFPSFDSFNPITSATEECLNKNQEATINTFMPNPAIQTSASSNGEFDHLMKAEAIMSFAPEYGAVETFGSELSSFFRRPYLPQSHSSTSDSRTNNYVYSAVPPSSLFDGSDEKSCVSLDSKAYIAKNDRRSTIRSRNYYIQVEGKKGQSDKRSAANADKNGKKEEKIQWQLSNYNSTNAFKVAQSSKTDGGFSAGNIIFSSKTLLATEVECLMLQASMCRMRHLLKSSSCNPQVSLTRFTRNSLANQLSVEPMTNSISARQEMKKNESIPVRIAGDMDGGILDSHLTAPDRVWRTVGFSKVAKPADSRNMDVGSSLPHGSYGEERLLSYGQRQPLQELLDGIVLLVQQATSFIDVALDSECGDGPHGWLALQELWRRELSCGPLMVHAGCGGTLASCHSLDISGVELMDPLSSEIHPSCVVTMLQSDIRTALKSAFSALDGPLSVSEWCKGRSHSGDGGSILDGSTAESAPSECRESSTTTSMSVVEQMSPSQSSVAVSSIVKVSSAMDGGKVEEIYQRKLDQDSESLRPTQFLLPSPAILVGYQDDWLKASPSSLQHWEKAPFEPYAVPKNVNYTVICPDIDPLTSAAADFFQQLGIVYEACRLGNHSPRSLGNQMEVDSGKLLSSGFVLLDCPQSMKIESSNSSLLGSLSDYFLSLSNGWNVTSYLKSLSKALTALKLGSCLSTSQKEGNSSPCMVVYIVCPFPEPMAVLQTIVESSVAVGSVIHQSDREQRSTLYAQVGRALNCSAAVDESSMSHIPVLSGFSIPKLVLQIVTVDSIFRITSPTLNELVILKEIAFAVYNKARRISRGPSNDVPQSSVLPSRSSVSTQMSSIQGIWKDCVGSRMTGPPLPREGEMDAGMRSGTWESSWQTSRSGGLSCDPNRNGDFSSNDEMRYLFEPLFILSEPGSVEHGVSPNSFGNSESSKALSDGTSRGFVQAASPMEGVNSGSGSQLDGLQFEDKALPSLHCCYWWTEDWRWLVSVWTDARGELLDSNIFPFGGISSRQDTKGLQCLFIQVLQQGCQILQACSSSDTGTSKPREFVITRIGNYFELEYQEWQKAIFLAGGPEVKKWPIQLRRSSPIGVVAGNNGTSLQPQDISLLQERTLPASANSLYSSHTKGFTKGGLGQSTGRKQVLSGQNVADMPSGLLQWVHSITFASVSIDHSLQLVCPVESPSPTGIQNGSAMGSLNYLDSFTPVKSLGSTSMSYMLIPSPSMRFLHPAPLQLPTVLTADSPPLAHLLHSKGYAIPLSTGFIVSKATPSMRKDHNRTNAKEEWPSVLTVSLVDHYGGYEFSNEKINPGISKQQGGRTLSKEMKESEMESHLILESVAAELHALSWMTVSPAYLDRRTAMPFHCDMVMKLRRLLHFADKELSRQPDKPRD